MTRLSIAIGHGVEIRWDDDGHGIIWRHPGCRPWFTLRFKPDPASTGHELVSGGQGNTSNLTVRGSLLCPKGCGFHGEIVNGGWRPV